MGTPQEIYEHPTSRFVADFIGEINLLTATVVDHRSVRLGGGTVVSLRPGRFRGAR